MDLEVIRRWAAALFAMCEQLLDAEDTPPHLLRPLLDIVMQVFAARARLTDPRPAQ